MIPVFDILFLTAFAFAVSYDCRGPAITGLIRRVLLTLTVVAYYTPATTVVAQFLQAPVCHIHFHHPLVSCTPLQRSLHPSPSPVPSLRGSFALTNYISD
jgi:hypothetical protein